MFVSLSKPLGKYLFSSLQMHSSSCRVHGVVTTTHFPKIEPVSSSGEMEAIPGEEAGVGIVDHGDLRGLITVLKYQPHPGYWVGVE